MVIGREQRFPGLVDGRDGPLQKTWGRSARTACSSEQGCQQLQLRSIRAPPPPHLRWQAIQARGRARLHTLGCCLHPTPTLTATCPAAAAAAVSKGAA